jgi:hypothetical protein
LVNCSPGGLTKDVRGAYPYELNVHWLEEVKLSDPKASDRLVLGLYGSEDFAIVVDVFQGDLSKGSTPFATVDTKLKPPLPTEFALRKTSSTRGVGNTIFRVPAHGSVPKALFCACSAPQVCCGR